MNIIEYFKGCKIRFTYEKEIDSWEVNHGVDLEYIKRNIRNELDGILKEKILEHIKYNFNHEIVIKIAKELLEGYDFKSAVQDSMHTRVKDYLNYKVL